VADHRRFAVRRATNHFDEILAGLSEPCLPHAVPFGAAIEKRAAAPPRDAQPQTPGREAATVSFSSPEALATTFQAPTDATPAQTIHALVQVTDNGTPPLTSFNG
jgi:hypothetical protein